MRTMSEESARRSGELRRENARLQQKAHDLSQQVSYVNRSYRIVPVTHIG